MNKIKLAMIVLAGAVMFGTAHGAKVKSVSEEYRDWAVVNGDNEPARYNALTVSSDNDGYLVYSCHVGDTCYLTLMIETTCDIGSVYPMLFNSDSGASAVYTTCIENHPDLDSAEYTINDPDAVLAETVFTDSRIGIAVPLADGKFTAIRFSLLGSDEAMARAMQLAGSSQKKGVESGEF